MRFQKLIPMLRTWDLRASIAFYTEVLGFEHESSSEDSSWAALGRDGIEVMLAAPNHHEGDIKAVFTGSLYFRTDQVDALWGEFSGKARVCYPIESFPYGMREFGIYDNNGYLLQFGQSVSSPSVADASCRNE